VNAKLAAGVSLFVLVFVGLWMSPAASGQAASGKAFGTVVDQQGGAVPQAKVTVTNEATNVSKTAETNNDGYFEVLDLSIGSYAIMIEHEGFEKYVSTSNRLLINQSLKFAIILKVGTVNQPSQWNRKPRRSKPSIRRSGSRSPVGRSLISP